MHEIVGNNVINAKGIENAIDYLLNFDLLKNKDYYSKLKMAAFFGSYLKQCNELSKGIYLDFLLHGHLGRSYRFLQMDNRYIEKYFDEFISGFEDFHHVMLKYNATARIDSIVNYVFMVNMSISERKIMNCFSMNLLDMRIMTFFIRRIGLSNTMMTSFYKKQNKNEVFIRRKCV